MEPRVPLVNIATLERRTAPMQQRARDRIDLVLKATERLLATTTVDTITTSSIAAEADVPVSSIYRYFPNVFAIYKELFETRVAQIHGRIAEILEDGQYTTWRQRHLAVMLVLRSTLSDDPIYRPLFHLMLTTRELRIVKDQANAQIASYLATRWEQGLDGFRGGTPLAVARMATEIFTSFETLTSGELQPELTEQLFVEATVALERYLSFYLTDDAAG
ncbi:TetR/AcrR family transcriptional regulator [Brevundimonas sp.]|uniref:TetR/AcrR family transcriptional regulator n=1 Tax=Brevundimonas sp. TaxID=1871086 RepID=UPI0028A1FBB5|nr:TetR/AcrR family transcriptional regulator [Brevundimonas sp.]